MTRNQKIAAALSGALAVGIVGAIALVGGAEEHTVVKGSDFSSKAASQAFFDRAGKGEVFDITRNGVKVATLGPFDAENPPTTTSTTTSTPTTTTSTSTSTTTTPPTGGGYPLISDSAASYAMDFDPGCNTSESTQVYNESSAWNILQGGARGCYARATSQGSGKIRAELGTPNLPAGTHFRDEFLWRTHVGASFQGYVSQLKEDETSGSCAQGGWSWPNDQGGKLLLRVRGDCNADHQDLDFGFPPKDVWIGLYRDCTRKNSGGSCSGRLDPDGPGPAPYGPLKTVTGDTSAGGTEKIRIGPYGSFPQGQIADYDEYRRING